MHVIAKTFSLLLGQSSVVTARLVQAVALVARWEHDRSSGIDREVVVQPG